MSILERTNYTFERLEAKTSIRCYIEVTRFLNALNQNTANKLTTALWALKLEGINEPQLKQIERVSGITYKTLSRNKEIVKELLGVIDNVPQNRKHIGIAQSVSSSIGHTLGDGTIISIPVSKSKLQDIEKIAMSLGINICSENIEVKATGDSIRNVMESLTMVALKEHKILKSTMSPITQYSFAKHYFNFYVKVISGSGKIYSKDVDRRWFYGQDNSQKLNKLLIKDSSYSTYNGDCMKFKPTSKAEEIIKRILELFKLVEFTNNDVFDSKYHILVDKTIITQVKFTDAIILLRNSIGFVNGKFIIDLNKQDTITDRVYSVFTSISSETRKALGYINYDIGAALQTITLQLVKDSELYSLHQRLVNDKTSFRNEVMQQTRKDLLWVKKELSKLDNMENYNTKIEILAEYFEEARCLRASLIEQMEVENDSKLAIAKSKASDILIKQWDDLKKEYQFTASGEKKESSVFFFIWTQYEREIREAMKIPFANKADILDVHDAIYSKEEVDITSIENAVLTQTGFKVKVSH